MRKGLVDHVGLLTEMRRKINANANIETNTSSESTLKSLSQRPIS